MRIYILKINEIIYKIPAEGLDNLSEKLFILNPDAVFTLLAINFPNIKLRGWNGNTFIHLRFFGVLLITLILIVAYFLHRKIGSPEHENLSKID